MADSPASATFRRHLAQPHETAAAERRGQRKLASRVDGAPSRFEAGGASIRAASTLFNLPVRRRPRLVSLLVMNIDYTYSIVSDGPSPFGRRLENRRGAGPRPTQSGGPGRLFRHFRAGRATVTGPHVGPTMSPSRQTILRRPGRSSDRHPERMAPGHST